MERRQEGQRGEEGQKSGGRCGKGAAADAAGRQSDHTYPCCTALDRKTEPLTANS